MSTQARKFWKALKCPVCGERAVFFVTMDAVLLISRIEEPKPLIASSEAEPKAKTKTKAKSKKTKKET
jgi:hypothetical protein